MPIQFGSTPIAKAYHGATELSQLYMGDVPLLATGPPVTDGLIMHLDAGDIASWDNTDALWVDLATGDGLANNWTKGANMSFVGTPGVPGSYFLGDGTNTAIFNIQGPFVNYNDLGRLQSSSQEWTVFLTLRNTAGANQGTFLNAGKTNRDDDNEGWLVRFTAGGVLMVRERGSLATASLNMGGPWGSALDRVFTFCSGPVVGGDQAFCKLSDGVKATGNVSAVGGGAVNDRRPEIGSSGSSSDRPDSGIRYYSFMYYNRVLSDAEITQVEDFLKASAGIA